MIHGGKANRRIGVFMAACCMYLMGMPGMCRVIVPDSSLQSEKAFSWGIETDFNSKYLWRGINYNDGFVIQPYVWASFRHFSAGIWSNLTAYDRHHSISRHETDLVLTYDYSIGKLEIDHTLMFYYYPGQEDSPPTGEIFLGLGYPIGDFRLISNITLDFLTYPGALFFEHGLEYEKEIGDKITLSTSAVLSWASRKFNDTYLEISKTAVNVVGADFAVNYMPRGVVYYRPHFQINRTLDKDLFPVMGKYPWFCGLLIGIEI